jgi:hypothetical protein
MLLHHPTTTSIIQENNMNPFLESRRNCSNSPITRGVVAHTTTLLPTSFQLGENDVFCGRGSMCFNHVGNKRFRLIVLSNLDRYAEAPTKAGKTAIIYEIVDLVRSNSPYGGFVKKDLETGRYYEIGDFLAVSPFVWICVFAVNEQKLVRFRCQIHQVGHRFK